MIAYMALWCKLAWSNMLMKPGAAGYVELAGIMGKATRLCLP